MDYVGETFRNIEVDTKGNSFRECHFENVTLRWGGGPIDIHGCSFHNDPRIILEAPFSQDLSALRAFMRGFGGIGVERGAEMLAHFMRQPPAKHVIDIT